VTVHEVRLFIQIGHSIRFHSLLHISFFQGYVVGLASGTRDVAIEIRREGRYVWGVALMSALLLRVKQRV
jgi:hypothetical protein